MCVNRCVHVYVCAGVCTYRHACVHVQVCVCTGVHTHTRASTIKSWDETTPHRAGERAPTPRCWATAWTAAMLSRAWGLKDWASQLGSAIQLPHLEHSISALPFSEGSHPRTGVRCGQQKSPESNLETYANTTGRYYPFIPMPRRVTFWVHEPHKWSLFLSQAAFSKGRRDADNVPKRQCFLILYYFQNKTAKSFSPPFVFPNKNKL